MKKYHGITLIEFLITTTLVVLALSIAVPSYKTYVDNARVTTTSNAFIGAMHLARSEAIKRGQPVSVCAAANTQQTACTTTGNWANGWLVFINTGSGQPANTASIIQKHNPINGQNGIASAQSILTFDQAGASATGTESLNIGPISCSQSHAKTQAITIGTTGHINTNTISCQSQSG